MAFSVKNWLHLPIFPPYFHYNSINIFYIYYSIPKSNTVKTNVILFIFICNFLFFYSKRRIERQIPDCDPTRPQCASTLRDVTFSQCACMLCHTEFGTQCIFQTKSCTFCPKGFLSYRTHFPIR